MKKILSITLVFISIISHAQTYTPIHTVGSATYLDSNKGSALISKDLILLQYKTKDSTQVLGIDSNGYVVLRTKGGGTAIVDSTIFGTHFYINSQGFLKSADILGKLNKSDSNILSGYYSYFAWLRDSSLIMNNFSNYATLTQLTNALAPYATIATTWTRTQIDSILTAKAYETQAHAAATYYPLSNPNGYINSESDPVANAKTVTINGNTQTIGSNPNFTIPPTDTNGLSARINVKLDIIDSNILKGYLSYYKYKMDSAMLGGNIALAVKYTDTALMLQNYIRAAGWGLLKIGQALLADSSLLLPRGDSNINGGYLPFWTYTQAPAYTITNTDKTHWNNAYNNYPTAISWNTTNGILTVTLNSGATLTTSLDSRYLTIAAWATDSAFIANSYWSDSLNAFAGTGRIGTKDNNHFDIYTNSLQRVRITKTGSIFVGTTTDLGYVAEFNGTMGANRWQGMANTPLSIDMNNSNYIKILNGILCNTGSGINSFTVSPFKSTVTGTFADTFKSADNPNNLYGNAIISVAKHTYKVNSTNTFTHYAFSDDIQYDTAVAANLGIDTLGTLYKHVRFLESTPARQKANYLLRYDYDYGGIATHAFWVAGFGNWYTNGTSIQKDTVFHHPKPGPNTTDSVLVFNAACGCELLAPMPSSVGGGGTPGGSSGNLQYNNSGALGGLSNANGGSDGFIQHTGQTTGAVAASSTATIAKEFDRILAGHHILATIDTATGEILYQPHGGMKNISHFWGWALFGDGIWNSFNTGSAGTSSPSYSATNLASNISVRTLPTTSTAGTSNGVYVCSPGQGFFTSSTRYGGGMFMIATFTMNTYNANQRFFCGFSNTAGCSLLTNADQSTVNNTVGINKDVADATFQFLTKGTGTATKTNTTITPSQNDMYRAIIFVPSNSTTVYEALIHYTVSGWDMQTFSATTNIPAAGVQMYPTIWVNNGSTAAVRTIGVDNIYTETDF